MEVLVALFPFARHARTTVARTHHKTLLPPQSQKLVGPSQTFFFWKPSLTPCPKATCVLSCCSAAEQQSSLTFQSCPHPCVEVPDRDLFLSDNASACACLRVLHVSGWGQGGFGAYTGGDAVPWGSESCTCAMILFVGTLLSSMSLHSPKSKPIALNVCVN